MAIGEGIAFIAVVWFMLGCISVFAPAPKGPFPADINTIENVIDVPLLGAFDLVIYIACCILEGCERLKMHIGNM